MYCILATFESVVESMVLEALSIINATMQTAAQVPVTLRNQNLDRKEMFPNRSSASVHFIHSPRAVGWLCNAVRTDCCTWRIANGDGFGDVEGLFRRHWYWEKGSFLSDSRHDMKLLSRNPVFAHIHLMLQIQPHRVNCAQVQFSRVHHKVWTEQAPSLLTLGDSVHCISPLKRRYCWFSRATWHVTAPTLLWEWSLSESELLPGMPSHYISASFPHSQHASKHRENTVVPNRWNPWAAQHSLDLRRSGILRSTRSRNSTRVQRVQQRFLLWPPLFWLLAGTFRSTWTLDSMPWAVCRFCGTIFIHLKSLDYDVKVLLHLAGAFRTATTWQIICKTCALVVCTTT